MRLNKPISVLSIITVFTCLLFAISCKNQGNQNGTVGDININPPPPDSVRINCVILTKAQIQQWNDSGWLNPSYPGGQAKKILLQLYSPNASQISDNIQLRAFPARNYSNVYNNGRIELAVDTSCNAHYLAGQVTFGNNFVDIDKLGIISQNGELINFSFIRFKPRQLPNPFVIYDIEVVNVVDGTEQVLSTYDGDSSDPCPPYCP